MRYEVCIQLDSYRIYFEFVLYYIVDIVFDRKCLTSSKVYGDKEWHLCFKVTEEVEVLSQQLPLRDIDYVSRGCKIKCVNS